jgi:hypothetical protein
MRERLIGTIRRECVDHVVAFSEEHLRQVLKSYASYYNTARTHRSLDKDAPVSRGLRPALVKGTKEIAPLTAFRDIDKLGLLKNVPTLNFHPHLPHYEITEKDSKAIQLLARQPIDPDRPHPFTAAGNTEFNCLLWMPPNQQRAGDIVLVDSTNFTTLFGGTESLQNFWKNFALMK